MFEYAYDLQGCTSPVVMTFDVLDANDIKKGELVKLLAPAGGVLGGRVTSLTTTYTSIVGVAAEDKVANDGKTRMKVYVSPSAVFACDAIATSALTNGSGSGTWGNTDLCSGTTTGNDDLLNGGKFKIKTKCSSSTMTKTVGTVVDITDYDAVSSTNGIISVAVGTPITGDAGYVFPPIGGKFITPTVVETYHNTGIGLPAASAAAETCLIVIDHDFINNKVLVKIANSIHQFAGHVAG